MKKFFPLLFASLLLLSGCAQKDSASQAEPSGDLTIALDSISETPSFIDGNIDGQPMQVIAVRDADGTVRLSYNTCQVCQGSPWAYFELQNGQLVCQNCGNAFALSAVGKGGYGCMPLMVPAYTLTEISVVIPHDTLVQVKDAFENWKVFP